MLRDIAAQSAVARNEVLQHLSSLSPIFGHLVKRFLSRVVGILARPRGDSGPSATPAAASAARPRSGAVPTMCVRVMLPTGGPADRGGRVTELPAAASDTVADLLYLVHVREGIPPERASLSLAAKRPQAGKRKKSESEALAALQPDMQLRSISKWSPTDAFLLSVTDGPPILRGGPAGPLLLHFALGPLFPRGVSGSTAPPATPVALEAGWTVHRAALALFAGDNALLPLTTQYFFNVQALGDGTVSGPTFRYGDNDAHLLSAVFGRNLREGEGLDPRRPIKLEFWRVAQLKKKARGRG